MNHIELRPSCDVDRSWQMSTADMALRDMPVRFAAVFDGCIEPAKFLASLKSTLVRYVFFHGSLRSRGNDLWVTCQYPVRSGEDFAPVDLEIAAVDEAFSDDRARMHRSDFIDGLLPGARRNRHGARPLLRLRLTNFVDAATIGIEWNHALSDLHGIYEFVSDLAKAYEGASSGTEPEPVFDRRAIWGSLGRGVAADFAPSRRARNDLVVVSKARARWSIARYACSTMLQCVPVCIFFDEEQLGIVKSRASAGGDRVSTNDVINATLMKLFAECSARENPDLDVGMYFPIDVRPLLGLGSSSSGEVPPVVANCLGSVSKIFRLADLRRTDLAGLARANRAAVDAYGTAQLVEDWSWADYWRSRGEKSVYHHWLFGKNRVYSSNWASAAIERAHFGDAGFCGILRSSQLNRLLLLPAFHSTVLPGFAGRRRAHVVRTSLRRSQLRVLRRSMREWKHIEEVIRIDTGERALRTAREVSA
jgi:hypothetical protein